LDHCAKQPVIWLSAPPGAGKTTLVASYLDSRNLSSLWYQMDEGDADIATFFYYLGLAVENGDTWPGTPLPLFTPEYAQGISTFSRRFFEILFSRLKPPAVVVFDNYEEVVAADAPFHQVIMNGLSVVPRDITVIVISRFTPPGILARLQVSKKMALIGWPELKLTLDETGEIVSLAGGATTVEAHRKIHEKTEGWAAGVILMMKSMGSGCVEPQAPDHMAPEEIFSYFSNEILAKTSAEIREFLLQTSFFSRMTSRMAARLTGNSKAGRILPYLVRNNYFTQMFAHSEPVYQYHPLFRGFLQAHADDHYPRQTICRIQRDAARLLVESGQIEDAVELLREADDWEELAPLLLLEAEQLVAQGRGKTLQHWLAGIPAAVLENSPWLSYWLGICQLPFAPHESRGHFEQAFHAFEATEDAAGTLLTWSGIIDTFFYELNDYTPLDLWIERLEERIRMNPAFPSPAIETRVSAAMVCALMWRQPHHPDMEQWLKRALSRTDAVQDAGLRMQACFNAANYHLWMGNLEESAIIIDEISRIAQSPNSHPLMTITSKWLEAELANCTAAPETSAIRIAEEGLALAASSGVHILDHLLFAQEAYSALNHGDTAQSEVYLKKMEATLHGNRRHTHCHFHYLASWHNFLLGNVARALAHAEKALDLAVETGFPLPEALCRLAVAQGAHESGVHCTARMQLDRAAEIIDGSGGRFLRYMYLMHEANLALDMGGEADALTPLQEALTLGRRKGYVAMFWWWRPPVMTRLFCKALEFGIEVDYVQEIIRKRGLFPDVPPTDLENWPWPIRIYTLGRFGIIKDGAPLRFSGKVQQKPLALLKALIALGGRDVAVDKLVDLLWPDADGDAAHQSFTTNLHRLRHMLGNDKAIRANDGKVTLDARYCWTDAWAFERIAGAVETDWKGTPAQELPTQAVRQIKRGMDLFNGHFLSGDPGSSWAVSMRERLRSKALRLIGKAGACHEFHGEWATAVECYLKGLAIDDHIEEFYQRLMICHHRLGRLGEALAAYDRCRRVFATIGGKPSERTRAIHEALLDGTAPEVPLESPAHSFPQVNLKPFPPNL
jgi:ATP/maltotriose-dependent transcriptional regulator MalT/DNA-binding SARP family transcriptional activator